MAAKINKRATKATKPAAVSAPETESLVNDAPRVFDDGMWPVGSVAHQGDVILVRIAGIPAKSVPRPNRQVAEGTTQGSRHVLVGGAVYNSPVAAVSRAIKKACPRADVGERYCGPVFVTDETTVLTHPEHGDHEYRTAGMVVAVVFQRNLDTEEREQRVRD